MQLRRVFAAGKEGPCGAKGTHRKGPKAPIAMGINPLRGHYLGAQRANIKGITYSAAH